MSVRNRALAGGALYLQPWSQVRNEIRITGTTITNNEALLNNEGLPPLRRPLPSVDVASVRGIQLDPCLIVSKLKSYFLQIPNSLLTTKSRALPVFPEEVEGSV